VNNIKYSLIPSVEYNSLDLCATIQMPNISSYVVYSGGGVQKSRARDKKPKLTVADIKGLKAQLEEKRDMLMEFIGETIRVTVSTQGSSFDVPYTHLLGL
jgi:hypothetical protein